MHHRRVFSRHAHNFSSNSHALAQAQDESHLLVRVTLQSHPIVSCPIVRIVSCVPILFTFPLSWRRNWAQTAPIHKSYHGFDSMAEQSPLTSCEPNNLIEISSEQQEVDHKKVRPIQMRELLREHVSRRLLAPSEEREIAAMTTSMRQIGVGSPGGAEALAIFHQLLYNEWMTDALSGSLARIKVDERKVLKDDRMAGSARGGVAVSPQAHGSRSMETSKLVSCRTRRAPATRQCRRIGEQSKETPTALWSAACLWGWRREHDGVAVQQAAGSFTWIGVHDPSEEQRLQADHATRMQVSASFQLGGPEKLTGAHDPQHPSWMTAMCHPILVAAHAAGIRRRQRQSRSGAETLENRSHLLRERPGCSAS